MRPLVCALVVLLAILSGGCQPGLNSAPAPRVTLALLGDVMLGRGIDASPDSFAYLEAWLAPADLALANLESPLSASPGGSDFAYNLCAPAANVQVLAKAGLDLLSLANNHQDDCGHNGRLETESLLTEAGLGSLGATPDPLYRTVNGLPLAFLAFDATGAFDAGPAARTVQTARQTGALVIVSMHWGAEYQAGASGRQHEIAAALSEAGASLVWGHHPHVLQPAVWIEGDKTLVLYSLGNALFDQYGLAGTRQSALVLVTLGVQGVESFEAVPFAIDVAHSQIIEPGAGQAALIMGYFEQ
jgi:poly-gamma-glutamate synthesis protein (capsule biosynthesis protein)